MILKIMKEIVFGVIWKNKIKYNHENTIRINIRR